MDGRATGATGAVGIGKIVRSESHVRYTCQIFGPGETAHPPAPNDYAFGAFVRIPLRLGPLLPDALSHTLPERPYLGDSDVSPRRAPDVIERDGRAPGDNVWAIGLLYDTILVNPAFGTLGPRLSNEEQVALFSPDYVMERAALVSILLLGTMTAGGRGQPLRVAHGVPPLAPDLGAVVSTLDDAAVRAFHFYADAPEAADALGSMPGRGMAGAAPSAPYQPYLHMGYLPHSIAQDHPLLPMALLRVIERLEGLFPAQRALLSIVRRNFAWRLKVQTAG